MEVNVVSKIFFCKYVTRVNLHYELCLKVLNKLLLFYNSISAAFLRTTT